MSEVLDVVQGESINKGLKNNDSQLDLFFTMHERINAKSEEISKSYNNNIVVTVKDVEELHYKTIQSIESLNPAKSVIGIRVVVSHNEGESEKFNSFDEFLCHNKTSPNPTANILMIYTFTLYDTEGEKFENYKITNHLRSRIAEIEQIQREAPDFLTSAIIASLVSTTASINIEYSDYVKARHFTAMFDEWIKGCDESKSSVLIKNIKKISWLFQPVGLMIIYILMAFFTSEAIDLNLISSESMMKFAVVYTSFFLVVRGVCNMALVQAHDSISGYLSVSYLDIGKGDKKLISDYGYKNKKSLSKAFFSFIFVVFVGVLTSFIYDFLKLFLSF